MADGTTKGQATMVNNMVTKSLGVSKTITRVKRTLTKSHGTTKIKNHGIRIRSLIMALKNLSPKMLVSLLCYIFDLAYNVPVQLKHLKHSTLTIRGVSIIYHTLY